MLINHQKWVVEKIMFQHTSAVYLHRQWICPELDDIVLYEYIVMQKHRNFLQYLYVAQSK